MDPDSPEWVRPFLCRVCGKATHTGSELFDCLYALKGKGTETGEEFDAFPRERVTDKRPDNVGVAPD